MTARVQDLVELIEGLVAIEEQVAARILADYGDEVVVVPLRPASINPPAIFNDLRPSQMDAIDTLVDRDTVIVAARIVVPFTDLPANHWQLLRYADCFRHVADPAFKDTSSPLGGAHVRRTGLQGAIDDIGGLTLLAIEFPIRARLDAANPAT